MMTRADASVRRVDVHNEWDPLEEVIIGSAAGARIPRPGPDLHAVEFASCSRAADIPHGPVPPFVVEKCEEELDALSEALRGLGVVVHRPGAADLTAEVSTGEWSSDGFYHYCPRDVLLAIGDLIIEPPMVLRSRFLEASAYKPLLIELFRDGARWLSAPKPRLADEMYDLAAPPGSRLRDLEPAFDAANVLRFGTDILYLVSDSGNALGGRWLQSVLGDRYTVHLCRGLYASTHVDSTIVPLRAGLVLLNPARVNEDNLPAFLRGWERIYAPEMEDIGIVGDVSRCSPWIGMNLLVVRPGLVIADDRQPALRRLLERHGIEVLPLRLTHARTMGGGFHCVSLDLRRRGVLDTYRGRCG